MTALNLLFGRKGGMIGSIQLDANLSEEHQYENQVTEFPVEEGADITDHIKLNPERLNIEGFITNSPIEVVYENVNEVIERKPGKVEVKKTESIGNYSRIETAHEALLAISGRKIAGKETTPQIVDLVTGLRVFTDMVITSLTIPRSADIGQALKFNASFVKIRKTNTQTIEIPKPQVAFKDKTSSKVEQGKQTPVSTTEKEKARVSAVKAMFNKAVRMF